MKSRDRKYTIASDCIVDATLKNERRRRRMMIIIMIITNNISATVRGIRKITERDLNGLHLVVNK